MLRTRPRPTAAAPASPEPGDGDGDGPAPAAGPTSLAAACLVAATLVVACAGGGFWPRSQVAVALAVLGAAALAAPRFVRVLAGRRAHPLVLAITALAGYTAVRAATGGVVGTAAGTVALLVGILVVIGVVASLPAADRTMVGTAVILTGVAAAATGLAGVALHLPRLTTLDGSAWRAASVLTYPNSLAALLAMVFLVIAGRLMAQPRDVRLVAAATVVLTGLGATGSRGGALGLAVGLVVLAALTPERRRLVLLAAPAAGTVVAGLALLPSMSPTGTARPGPALVGVLAGIAAAAALHRLTLRRLDARPAPVPATRGRNIAVALGLALGLVVAVSAAAATATATAATDPTGFKARLSPVSGDRADGLRAAGAEIGARPWFGRGPGDSSVSWRIYEPDGAVTTATLRFVHNEYVQVVLELGLAGGVLLVLLIAVVARLLGQARVTAAPPEWGVAVIAAVAALGVHSALDFLWHLPVLPLTAAALIGVAVAPHLQGEPSP